MNKLIVLVVLAVAASSCKAQARSAQDLAFDMYDGCLKDFNVGCVKPKAMQWLNEAAQQDEIMITDKLSIVRTRKAAQPAQEQRSSNPQEKMFDDIDNFLATHALRIKAPEYFRSAEARAFVPDFLLNNALTNGAVVPLASAEQGRGMIRKAVLPFLLGLKLKTTVLVPLALALIALKTWKAMTLGLLSLVLSGALVIFKIAKPKIVNYEVVHYPPPHVEHIEHIPHHHHVEHIVPHHLDHHIEHHHVDVPHHVEHHVEHVEHPAPTWDPHAWSRSSHEPQDAQDMAYNGQNRR